MSLLYAQRRDLDSCCLQGRQQGTGRVVCWELARQDWLVSGTEQTSYQGGMDKGFQQFRCQPVAVLLAIVADCKIPMRPCPS